MIPFDAGMDAMIVAVPFTMILPSFLVIMILSPLTCPIFWPSCNDSALYTPTETWYCKISVRASFFSGFNNYQIGAPLFEVLEDK